MLRHLTGPRAALSLVSALSLGGAALPLAAQDDDSDGRVRVYTTMTDRPRIGVMVDSRPNAETDRWGARISDVTPDGPAAKAGLKAGDVITKFNGTSLGGLTSEDEDASGPGRKLVELARALDVGDTVQVEYRRDGQGKRATLVAEDLGTRNFTMRVPGVQLDRLPMRERMPLLERMPDMPMPMPDGPNTFKFEQGPQGSFRVFTDGFASANGLKLAELNPDLGEYFGTREGVLVLEAPKDSSSTLRAGDVILSIDGRTVKTDEQAQRIFRSYTDGETAKLEVMRKQRKLTVTWKASEREGGRTFMRTPRPTRERTRVERS